VMSKAKVMPPLATSIPTQFGDWTEIKSSIVQADLTAMEDGQKSINQPYDDVLTRTYVNKAGDQVMLALAYAKEQRQDVKIHLPEVCYPAQGYQVISNTLTSLPILANGATIPGKRLLTTGNGRTEAVSYWVRIGDAYPIGGLATRMKIFSDGIGVNVTDGMLVRASMLIDDAASATRAYATQEGFLRELVSAIRPNAAYLIIKKLHI
jgi:EpsI family protein